jgi:N-acetylglutamate synthase-like GNAT family acetyltransferase
VIQALSVCDLKLSDTDAILGLLATCKENSIYTETESRDDLEWLFKRGSAFVGIMQENKLIGCASLVFDTLIESNRLLERHGIEKLTGSPVTARLFNCAVHPDHRGKGLQSTLIKARESIALGKGVSILYTTIDNRNTTSIRNMIANGFDRVGTRINGSYWGLYAKNY